MNRVEIRGGLVRDVELKYVGQSGVACMEMTVAVNGTRYDSQQRTQVVKTTFVSVQVWGLKAEETAERYRLSKGDEVYVLGELDQREVEKADGTKERKTRVTALLIDVLRCRNTQHPTTGTSAAPTAAPAAPGADPWAGPPRQTQEPPF